jgi:hypothetical protein
MLQHISGGRGDGTAWPHIGGTLDVGDDEARHLVGGKLARWAEDAEPAADRAELAGDGQTAASAGEGEGPGPEDGSQPLVRDPKQAWVDHAVEQGAPADEAAAMTKADLIEKYGNPA